MYSQVSAVNRNLSMKYCMKCYTLHNLKFGDILLFLQGLDNHTSQVANISERLEAKCFNHHTALLFTPLSHPLYQRLRNSAGKVPLLYNLP